VPRIGETAPFTAHNRQIRPHSAAGDQLSAEVVARLRQHEHPHTEGELHQRRGAKQHETPTRPSQQRPDTDRLCDRDRTNLIASRAYRTLQPHERVVGTERRDLRRPV
jgi:hypothetical protein